MVFRFKRGEGLVRKGVLQIKDKEIRSPLIWRGIALGDSESFQATTLKKCGVKSYLTNAHYLLQKKQSLHHLKGELEDSFHMMDSGGYQLQTQCEIKVKPLKLIDTQLKSKAEIVVQLDHPYPHEEKERLKNKILKRNLNNLEALVKEKERCGSDASIMPVLHPCSREELERWIEGIRILVGKIKMIGIGGLVPILRRVRGDFDFYRMLEMLVFIRKRLPNAFIHCFGLNGMKRNLAFLCGMDSVDSLSWYKDSVSYKVMNPFADKINLWHGHDSRKSILYECVCEACSEHDDNWERLYAFSERNERGKIRRIKHNITVSQLEARIISEGRAGGFLRKGAQSSYIQFVKELEMRERCEIHV